ncbi:hypothetical protein SeLEV6574_g06667 [Synchytrium endobioticum]|nr:hypothetical protein SeLEV6574_g06667 [Synchytrium endobioticum]
MHYSLSYSQLVERESISQVRTPCRTQADRRIGHIVELSALGYKHNHLNGALPSLQTVFTNATTNGINLINIRLRMIPVGINHE